MSKTKFVPFQYSVFSERNIQFSAHIHAQLKILLLNYQMILRVQSTRNNLWFLSPWYSHWVSSPMFVNSKAKYGCCNMESFLAVIYIMNHIQVPFLGLFLYQVLYKNIPWWMENDSRVAIRWWGTYVHVNAATCVLWWFEDKGPFRLIFECFVPCWWICFRRRKRCALLKEVWH